MRRYVAFCGPGGDLLSRVLRRSTIGAGVFHGRVRDGNGCGHPAMTTRSAKRNIFEKLVLVSLRSRPHRPSCDGLACAGAPHERRRPVGLAKPSASGLLPCCQGTRTGAKHRKRDCASGLVARPVRSQPARASGVRTKNSVDALRASRWAFVMGTIKSIERLVLVSFMRYRTSTSSLSTWSSSTALIGTTGFQVGFPLRCFQRLSIPHIATLLCRWRDNRSTRDVSTPVLSY